jgi:hypothetical protein
MGATAASLQAHPQPFFSAWTRLRLIAFATNWTQLPKLRAIDAVRPVRASPAIMNSPAGRIHAGTDSIAPPMYF